MSRNQKTPKLQRADKTEILRGRCEPGLKQKFVEFVNSTRIPNESHWVREAVVEFMDTHKPEVSAK